MTTTTDFQLPHTVEFDPHLKTMNVPSASAVDESHQNAQWVVLKDYFGDKQTPWGWVEVLSRLGIAVGVREENGDVRISFPATLKRSALGQGLVSLIAGNHLRPDALSSVPLELCCYNPVLKEFDYSTSGADLYSLTATGLTPKVIVSLDTSFRVCEMEVIQKLKF